MADNNASLTDVNLASLADNNATGEGDDKKVLDQVSKMGDMNPYMKELERNVEGAIFDDIDIDELTKEEFADNNTSDVVDQDNSEGPSIEGMSSNEVETYKSELENLKRRYESSSEEAKRLNAKLKELEEYTPVIEVMRENPEIIDKIADYLETGGDALQPPEDFNMEDAMTDPNSDSARFMSQYMDQMVQAKFNQRAKELEKKNNLQSQKDQAIKDLNISEEEIQSTIDYWKDRGITIKDLVLLKNLPERDKKIVNKAIQDRITQAEKISGAGRSLGSVNAQRSTQKKDPNKEVFNLIKSTVDGMDIFNR